MSRKKEDQRLCSSTVSHRDVILNRANVSRSCPSVLSQQHSGICQVSAMTCGKQSSKECGSAILRSLLESLAKDLQDIVRCIKGHNELDVEKNKEPLANKSASMLDLKTPEKSLYIKDKALILCRPLLKHREFEIRPQVLFNYLLNQY